MLEFLDLGILGTQTTLNTQFSQYLEYYEYHIPGTLSTLHFPLISPDNFP